MTDSIQSFYKANKLTVIPLCIAFLLACSWELLKDQKVPLQQNSRKEKALSVDTYIPVGHVFVPIEISNKKALHSFLGQYGVVDLYEFSARRHDTALAENIPIVRAPLDPNQYAVVVPENQAAEIVKRPGPFRVVIQHPDAKGTRIRSQKPATPASRIQIEAVQPSDEGVGTTINTTNAIDIHSLHSGGGL